MAIARREVLKWGSTLAAAVMPVLKAGTALAQPAADPYLAYIHPELREAATRLMQMFPTDPLSIATLERQRAGMVAYTAKPAADIRYEKREIPGGKGQPAVTVYVVNAGKEGERPGLLHTHGGGYVMGSALSEVSRLQALCKELDCVAVSVEYRLAPETTFRGSIEDNYAGLKWLHDNADALGVDPARIAVYGGSAGGGHAALLAITARDRGEVPLAFQCLIYPMLDDRTGTSRHVPAHVGKITWTPERNRFGWESFLGTTAGGRSAPKGAVPARIENLAGLPPAFIGVGSIDLFCDEDVDYAQRLNAAGVPAEMILVPGAFHGFDGMPETIGIVRWFNAAKIEALRRGLGIS